MTNFHVFVFSKLDEEFVLSHFLVYHMLFPLYNISRSFYFQFHPQVVFGLMAGNVVLWLGFKLFSTFYRKTVKLVFHKKILPYRFWISFGAILSKEYSVIFGIFLFVSFSSYRLMVLDPENVWIHCFYVFSVVFRNLFLVPHFGYVFILRVNQMKNDSSQSALLDDNSELKLLLFQKSGLEKDKDLFFVWRSWVNWLSFVKPTLDSLKTTGNFSLFSFVFWFLLSRVETVGEIKRKVILDQQQGIKKSLSHLISLESKNPVDVLCSRLANRLQFKSESIFDEFPRNAVKNDLYLSYYFFFKKEKIMKIFTDFDRLREDVSRLSLCHILVEKDKTYLKTLKHLAQLHYPELLLNESQIFDDCSESLSHSSKTVVDHLHNQEQASPIPSSLESSSLKSKVSKIFETFFDM